MKLSEHMTPGGAYVLFERTVSAVLLAGMAAVILLATYSFLRSTTEAVIDHAEPLDFAMFQVLFDRVLAAIIALELAHSVQQMVTGHRGLVQVRTVIIIGVLAVVRKLILVDIETTSGLFLLGIAGAILSLGIVLALVQWVESRRQPDDEVRTPGAGPSE